MGTAFTRRCVVLAVAIAIAGCDASAAATLTPAGTERPAPTEASTPSLVATVDPSSSVEPTVGATTQPSGPPEPGRAPIGPTEIATVVSITDGDTIRIDRGHGSEKVRYIGMNTPEVGDPGGSEATAENTKLVEGQQVVLERDVSETDMFGRLLRYVWIHDGPTWVFVNLELVTRGYAQTATYPPDVRYVDLFTAAEQEARDGGVGLWAAAPDPDPTDDPGGNPGGSCHPSYTPCLPITGDLDCADLTAMGIDKVKVIGPDDYRLDGDHDGYGCE